MSKTISLTGKDSPSPENTVRETPLEKEKQKRVITHTKKWVFTETDYETANQLHLIRDILSSGYTNHNHNDNSHRIILQQINQKIAGYKAQDIAKSIYDPGHFITVDRVIELLQDSELQCHYCKKDIKVLYEVVRDPLQWTLDRIDNDYGHNDGNLFISCLSCNLRRKTIDHGRYELTKICTNVVKLS